MIAKRILNYIFGTILIIVEGFFTEKYINICANKKIELNNIKRDNSCVFTAKVKIKDYIKLKHVCKITKCKMKILKKSGLPFILHRYRKRKIILIPIIITIGLLVYSNCLIWNIKVIDNQEEINNEVSKKIIQTINENGIHKFSFKYFLDKQKIKNKVLIEVDELSWIELDIKGVTLIIEIHTRIEKPELEKNEICNIIANKSGIIEKMIVRNGNAIVKKNDVVEKGDILVSYIIPSEYIDERFVYTDADIFARTWYSAKISILLNEQRIMYTGKKQIFYGTSILRKKLFFKKLSTNYKEYDTILKKKKLTLGNYKFPINIYEYIIMEKETIKIQRTVEEAKNYGIELLQEKLLSEMISETVIFDKRVIVNKYDDNIEVELIYECIEQIGTKEKIY